MSEHKKVSVKDMLAAASEEEAERARAKQAETERLAAEQKAEDERLELELRRVAGKAIRDIHGLVNDEGKSLEERIQAVKGLSSTSTEPTSKVKTVVKEVPDPAQSAEIQRLRDEASAKDQGIADLKAKLRRIKIERDDLGKALSPSPKPRVRRKRRQSVEKPPVASNNPSQQSDDAPNDPATPIMSKEGVGSPAPWPPQREADSDTSSEKSPEEVVQAVEAQRPRFRALKRRIDNARH